MASSFCSPNLTFFYSSTTKPHTTNITNNFIIHCGPRDNRGPLQKGRILSTEAMQAIQALKRAKSDETKLNQLISTTLTRLLKNDLIASLNELIRQNHCDLALKVFSTVRSEFWYKTDCSLYADMVSALAKNDMLEDIDRLMLELEEEGLMTEDCGRISRLIKELVKAQRTESVVRIYGAMKDGGWECRDEVDEYVVKVLSRGLRRLGEDVVADEVERELGGLSVGITETTSAGKKFYQGWAPVGHLKELHWLPMPRVVSASTQGKLKRLNTVHYNPQEPIVIAQNIILGLV